MLLVVGYGWFCVVCWLLCVVCCVLLDVVDCLSVDGFCVLLIVVCCL